MGRANEGKASCSLGGLRLASSFHWPPMPTASPARAAKLALPRQCLFFLSSRPRSRITRQWTDPSVVTGRMTPPTRPSPSACVSRIICPSGKWDLRRRTRSEACESRRQADRLAFCLSRRTTGPPIPHPSSHPTSSLANGASLPSPSSPEISSRLLLSCSPPKPRHFPVLITSALSRPSHTPEGQRAHKTARERYLTSSF